MNLDIKITFDTRLARLWVWACALIARVVGANRLEHVALQGARRLIRWRIGTGAWRRGVS